MPKQQITTDRAPAPSASYSQGVAKNGILQVSGQTGVDPQTKELVPGGVGAQTTRTLANLEGVLAAGGADFSDVVMLRVYLTSPDLFAPMNEAYGAFLTERLGQPAVLPSRTTVMVTLARPELLVEIDALAVLG